MMLRYVNKLCLSCRKCTRPSHGWTATSNMRLYFYSVFWKQLPKKFGYSLSKTIIKIGKIRTNILAWTNLFRQVAFSYTVYGIGKFQGCCDSLQFEFTELMFLQENMCGLHHLSLQEAVSVGEKCLPWLRSYLLLLLHFISIICTSAGIASILALTVCFEMISITLKLK